MIHALRWNSSGLSNYNDPVISLQTLKSDLKVDIHPEEIVIIRDILGHSQTITIYCFITGFNDHSDISYSFCKVIPLWYIGVKGLWCLNRMESVKVDIKMVAVMQTSKSME